MIKGKIDAGIGHYNVDSDELFAALANCDFLEPITSIDFTDNTSNVEEVDKATIAHGTKIPTPHKGEKSLKRQSADTTEMEVDAPSKRAKTSSNHVHIISLDEDDDQGSINQGTTVLITKEKELQRLVNQLPKCLQYSLFQDLQCWSKALNWIKQNHHSITLEMIW